jgi:hypothetical protein
MQQQQQQRVRWARFRSCKTLVARLNFRVAPKHRRRPKPNISQRASASAALELNPPIPKSEKLFARLAAFAVAGRARSSAANARMRVASGPRNPCAPRIIACGRATCAYRRFQYGEPPNKQSLDGRTENDERDPTLIGFFLFWTICVAFVSRLRFCTVMLQ